MNRKIIFGTLLSAFILLLLPSVPAVESNKILEANESSIINEIKQMGKEVKDLQLQIKNIDLEELNERFKNTEALFRMTGGHILSFADERGKISRRARSDEGATQWIC